MSNDEKSLILESVIELQEKYKNKECYLSSEDISALRKDKGWFKRNTVWNKYYCREYLQEHVLFGFKSGIVFTNKAIISLHLDTGELAETEFRFDRFTERGQSYYIDSQNEFYEYLCSDKNIKIQDYGGGDIYYKLNFLKLQKPNILISSNKLGLVAPKSNLDEIKIIKGEIVGTSMNPGFRDGYHKILHDKDEVRFFEELESLVEHNRCKKYEDIENKENQRVKQLKSTINSVLSTLDKDGNGEVDAVEGNDFNTLLKKHQKTILEIDRNYVKKFVKISTYLKDKKANIQDIFNSISDTPNESVLNEYVGILKNEVNTYHMILANGLTMLVALIEDDVITYEEIYESMDRINIFDSQWEKDVSQKLTNIGDGLNALMYEIEASNRRIVNELSNLTYATEQGFSELNSSITSELQSIDSSIKFNNLLTGIQTYQMYKINKNTKSLRT